MKHYLYTLSAFMKKEVVFCIASLLALLSMIWVHPSMGYFAYIDFRVLALLYCLMLVVAGLNSIGLFDQLASFLLRFVHTTRQLATLLVLICFFLSMWITNDVALITFVPFAILILHRTHQDSLLIPIIIMQTIAANLGSMCTPLGNPQNLYLYSASNMSPWCFFSTMLPLSVFALVLILCSMLLFPKNLLAKTSFSTRVQKKQTHQTILYLSLLLLCLLTIFRLIDYRITLILVVLLLFLVEARLLLQADYILLLTFVAFFLFVGNVKQLPAVNQFLQSIVAHQEIPVSILVSQIISNVPAAVLLSGFSKNCQALLIGTNLGGLGTLIASMASLISYKYYCATTDCKPRRYLFLFTFANLLYLLILYIGYQLF